MSPTRLRMATLLARRALHPRAVSTRAHAAHPEAQTTADAPVPSASPEAKPNAQEEPAKVTHTEAEVCVARSLRDVARDGPRVQALQLASSEDLVCRNLMCEHVGEACACRLALVLERAPKLETLDLRGNDLRALPDSAFALPQLAHLDASRNRLTTLSPLVGQLTALETLDLRGNRLTALPLDALASLPRLREVHVAHNPALALADAAVPATLRGKLRQHEHQDEHKDE